MVNNVCDLWEMNILASGNRNSGNQETDVPEEGNSLIDLTAIDQEVQCCQAQSHFAVR